MNIFLGYMDYNYNEYSDYKIYNFYPLYEKSGETFVKIENPKELFKEYGNFAIFRDDNYMIDEQFKKGEYCIIELSDEDIEDNLNNYDRSFRSSHKRIHIDKLDRAGKVRKLSDYDLYPIVEASSWNLHLEKSGPIELNEAFPINRFSKKVLLYDSGYYYGPFDATSRSLDKKMVLLNNIDKCSFICDRYSILNNDEEILLYCDPQSYSIENIKILPLKSQSVEKGIKDFLIDDKSLLNDYINFIKKHGDTDDINDINEGGKKYFESIQNETIAKKRFDRLKVILSNQENFASYQSELSDLIVSFVIDNSDKESIKSLFEKLSNDQTFMNKIQNVRVIQESIERLKSDLDQLETKNNSLENEKLAKIKEEIRQLEDEKIRIVEEVNQCGEDRKKIALSKDIETLQSEYDSALKNWGRVELMIENKMKEATDSVTQILFNDQFDKLVYEKMTNNISEFENENEAKKYLDAKEKIKQHETLTLTGKDLIDNIVSEVQKYRQGYDRNTIINILICISQGLLTVFSGKPGTGKTSICKIIAHVLGLDNPLDTQDGIGKRFTNVHVERGWNSKRDLIGYYNPLSRKIEKNNIDIYNAFKILNLEANNGTSKLPMFILLDEANLSPMEFYWADFVGMCDDFLFENNTINLGDNEKLLIPNTLRFLATINNDHTTEAISPRLIDRTFVITLNNNQSTNNDTDDFKNKFYSPVEYKDLYDSINYNDKMNKEQIRIYNYFEKSFKELRQDLSPRIKKSVENYCSSANNLFSDQDGIDKTIISIDYALSQKVITKIQGGNDKYTNILKDLSDYCSQKNLLLTKQHLDRIYENGVEDEYYQFFD